MRARIPGRRGAPTAANVATARDRRWPAAPRVCAPAHRRAPRPPPAARGPPRPATPGSPGGPPLVLAGVASCRGRWEPIDGDPVPNSRAWAHAEGPAEAEPFQLDPPSMTIQTAWGHGSDFALPGRFCRAGVATALTVPNGAPK